jgi:hypothetical protein
MLTTAPPASPSWSASTPGDNCRPLPPLSLDEDDNLLHTSGCRSMYCTLLESWIGVDAGADHPGRGLAPTLPSLID